MVLKVSFTYENAQFEANEMRVRFPLPAHFYF